MAEPTDGQGKTLRWDDHIEPILEHPDIPIREKALVAVTWDSHPKVSELHRLNFANIEDAGQFMTITITSQKGGDRKLTIFDSVPHLKEWLQAHPVNEEIAADADPLADAAADTPLWTETQQNKRLSMAQLQQITEQAGKRANIESKISPKAIRRSRATELINADELTPLSLGLRFGWTV